MGGGNPQNKGGKGDAKMPKDAKGGPKSAPPEKTVSNQPERPR